MISNVLINTDFKLNGLRENIKEKSVMYTN